MMEDIFVYMGGDQRVPDDVRWARIHGSVKTVRARAFQNRQHLISVDFHNNIGIIEEEAFEGCISLRGGIRLLGIKIIKARSFSNCKSLASVECGDKLETIEDRAFKGCESLRTIAMSSVKNIGWWAFFGCGQLKDVQLSEVLETLQMGAFHNCHSLGSIAMPLREIRHSVFHNCQQLRTVVLVGGIHNIVDSLHFEKWSIEMKGEINRINQALSELNRIDHSTTNYDPHPITGEVHQHNYPIHKTTEEIQQWMRSVICSIDRYKNEHNALLKEATTLLELATWKAKIEEQDAGTTAGATGNRTTREQWRKTRNEKRIKSGADVIIKNVLPFLVLK